MNLRLKAPVLVLTPGQVVALDDAAGASIRSGCGTVWITQENEIQDVVIGPGEQFVVSRPGRTLVQALNTARVSIRDPQLPQAA